MEKSHTLKKELGLVMATALVTGNMIGSGIFMLPATLASTSGPGATMIAWLLTGLGSICIALSFARLGSIIPKTGGPYEYSKEAFGGFVGFLSAWLYWNGSWIGNAAIITTITSYTSILIPSLAANGLYSFLFSSIVLWIFTILNIVGVKEAGKTQTAITVFKVGLFVIFIIVAAFNFNIDNLKPLFPSGKGISTMPKAAAATLWAFIGLESASVTGGEIKDPEKNIKRSTILGISITVALYFLISFLSMGAMPIDSLSKSSAPIADILSKFFGTNIGKFITIATIISMLGATIGWLLSTARVAYAAGEDETFPKFFSKVHPKYGTPHVALIIGSVFINILLFMSYNSGFVAAFNFITILATLSFIPVYVFTIVADMMLTHKYEKFSFGEFLKKNVIQLIAFIYSIWTVVGSGAETAMYGLILILLSLPFYGFLELKKKSKKSHI